VDAGKSFNFYFFLLHLNFGGFQWLAVPLRLENFRLPQNLASRRPRSNCQPKQIRRRAYELYELRGGGEGLALDDWLKAEAEFHSGQEDTAA